MPQICPKCKALQPDNIPRCGNCGAKLQLSETEETVAQVVSYALVFLGVPVALVVIMIVIVVLAVGL